MLAQPPPVRIEAKLPSVIRSGVVMAVTGRVQYAPPGVEVALESKQGRRWRIVVRRPLPAHRSKFTLRWRVSTKGFGLVSLRVAALADRRRLAATRARYVLVGPAPVYCARPSPPSSLPAGDGWITGGVYIAGGPAPGVFSCEAGSHTVTATDTGGQVVATANPAIGGSYTIVLPPGRYELRSGFCRGTATVRAGQRTKADTVCPVP